MHRTLRLVVGGLLFMAVSTFVGAFPASASTSGTDPGRVVVNAAGGSAGWVSNEYLKAHPDAIPGMKYNPTSSRLVESAAIVEPDSASGCDSNVCINIDGDSTLVTSWTTTAYGNTGCAIAYFAYHASYYVGPQVCPDGGGSGVYYDSTGPHGLLPRWGSALQLLAEWTFWRTLRVY